MTGDTTLGAYAIGQKSVIRWEDSDQGRSAPRF
jgi:hypothetical protein